MRIVFAGTPPVAVPTLEALAASTHDVVSVVTRPDAPVGRKRRLTPSAVAARGESLGLPVLRAARLGDDETVELAATAPDLGVVVAYGGLVREPLLATPRHGWINLHFSLLPAWRGAAPVQRSLMAGEDTAGVSVFRLEAGLDTGPLARQRATPVHPGETADELLERLGREGADDVLAVVDAIADGTVTWTPQTGDATHAAKLTAEDGRIDWTRSVTAIDAHVRGVTSEPGAVTTLREDRFKILRAHPAADDSIDLGPGVVRRVGGRVLAGTGDGFLELVTVQPVGKAGMPADAWWNGVGTDEVVFA